MYGVLFPVACIYTHAHTRINTNTHTCMYKCTCTHAQVYRVLPCLCALISLTVVIVYVLSCIAKHPWAYIETLWKCNIYLRGNCIMSTLVHAFTKCIFMHYTQWGIVHIQNCIYTTALIVEVHTDHLPVWCPKLATHGPW